MTDGISDDDAARLDVSSLLAAGLADETGELRGELQGEGALAAAVQLERAGVHVEEVALALSHVRSAELGIDVEPAALTAPLDGWAQGGEPVLRAEWLGLVANLMMMRAAYR
jgi:hypothetical protein